MTILSHIDALSFLSYSEVWYIPPWPFGLQKQNRLGRMLSIGWYFFIETSIMAVEVAVMNDITLMVEWTLHICNHGLRKEWCGLLRNWKMIFCCPFMSASWPFLSMRYGLSMLKSIFELVFNWVYYEELYGKWEEI